MAGSVPASHTFKGDGLTRVFPISTRIIGDDYIRIEIDNIYKYDRSSWDIVNNSIIFTVAPIVNSTILIKVAESVEAVGLLDNQSTADIIEANIPTINSVYNSLDKLQNIEHNLGMLNGVNNALPSIELVKDNLTNINIISSSLGDLQSIKNHNNLTNRNAPNAHPISAITGLNTVLDGMSNDGGLFPSISTDYLTKDTYLSCKISPTELRAINIDNIFTPIYYDDYTTNKYKNLITTDVYGLINKNDEQIRRWTAYSDKPFFREHSDLSYVKIRSIYLPRVFYTVAGGNTIRKYYVTGKNTYQTTNSSNIPHTPSKPATLTANISFGTGTRMLNNGKILYFNHGPSVVTKHLIFFDTLTETYEYIDVSGYNLVNAFIDSVEHPNGYVYMIPYNSQVVLKININTLSVEALGLYGNNLQISSKAHLGYNGNIYIMPDKYSKIIELNTQTNVFSEYGTIFATAQVNVVELISSLHTNGNILFALTTAGDFKIYEFNITTKAISVLYDFRVMFNKVGLVDNSGIASVTTGVDGNLYVSVSKVKFDGVFPPGITLIRIDLETGVSQSLGSYETVTSKSFADDGDIIYNNRFKVEYSNKGKHFWLMSNYTSGGQA